MEKFKKVFFLKDCTKMKTRKIGQSKKKSKHKNKHKIKIEF